MNGVEEKQMKISTEEFYYGKRNFKHKKKKNGMNNEIYDEVQKM